MKKLTTKSLYIVWAILLFTGACTSVHAQLTGATVESGGLYSALAKDKNGNLYVTRVKPDAGGLTYEVEKYINGSGTPTVIYQNLTHELGDYPWGLAVTSTGNVYISTDFTAGGGAIIKLTYNSAANSYTPAALQTGRYFSALAVDAGDNLYDTEYDAVNLTYAVVEYTANSLPNSAGTKLYDNLKAGVGYAYPTGLAVASNGDIYVADAFSNTPLITDGAHVYKLTKAASYAVTTVSTGQYSSALALDGSGNLYSSENSGGGYQLIEYPGGAGTGLPIYGPLHTNGIYYPWGIAITNNGIFVVDGDDGTHGGEVLQMVAPPAPTVSYKSPQVYNVGTSISPLAPTSTNVAAPAYSSLVDVLGTAFAGLGGIAVDASGNVYASNFSSAIIQKIPAGGGAPVIIGSGFTAPYGVAVDAAGNVYVADYAGAAVYEVPVGGGTPVSLGSGFTQPAGVAVDAAGDVFVADFGASTVKEIPVGGGAITTIGSGFSTPSGVTVDGSGNVFVADYGNNAVKEVPAGGGTPVVLGSGFDIPFGIAVDPEGNVFIADYGNSAVKEIPAGGTIISLASGFSVPTGVAVDGSGNLYIADYGNSAIKKVKPVGGYYAWPFLPAGLSYNGGTGTLSGTPTVLSPAANYTVTAYNAGASSMATINITVNHALPAISYTGPQNYNINKAITPLTPTSSNVAAAGYSSGAPVVLGSGFSGPTGVAADAAGNVYVADYSNKLVKKIPAGNGTPVVLGSGFTDPYGVAVDGSGNVYVADFGGNAIYRIPGGTGTPVKIGSGFNTPAGVTVDGAGNVYVADYGNNAVKEIVGGTGTPVVLGSGFSHPIGISVDASGNVYVGDHGNNLVKKIPAGNGAPVVLGSGFSTPSGVAVDASGNIYVGDYGNSQVKMIPAGSNTPVVIGSGFSHPDGVAVDGAGNVYVADYSNNAVKQIQPTGGYYIGPLLPAGLTFNNSTGTLSGTPTVASAATAYKITAYNGLGFSGTTPLTLSVTVQGDIPSFSYSSPQVYGSNVAIAPLTPTSSNVAAAGYSSTPGVLGSGFSGPTGLAADASGNVYVADYGNKLVKKIPAGNGTPVVLGTGFTDPYGVAVDAAGDVFVADYGASAIYKLTGGTGTPVKIGSGFSTPAGVAVDGSGNVYVADYGNNAVKEIVGGVGTPVILGSGFSHPIGISVDASGNVYVGDHGNSLVKKIPAGNGTPVVLGSGFSTPSGVAVDASGNIYVGDYGNNQVKMIPAGSSTPVVIGSGFSHPDGVVVDGAGNVYIADYTNNAVKQIKPAGGYYVNPFLPAGLAFNNSTGVVSGTPIAVSPATAYKVTGYNGVGISGTASINITVNLGAAVLNYSSPQTYTQNTAITPLTPVSTNVAAAGYNSSPAVLGSGFSSPTGVAADVSGNVYVADYGNKLVKKIPAGNGTPVVLGTGFTDPYGVAVDAAGDVFVADYGASAIYKLTGGTGTPVKIGSGFSTPAGVAVDGSGNVYVADYGNNAVKEIVGGVGTPVILGSGFSHPIGISVDASGNVYVGDHGNSLVKKITAGNGAPVVLGSGFSTPSGVAVDASGNIYVGDYGNNQVKMIPAGSSAPVLIGSGFSHPDGIAVDGAGNVYVADYTNNAVKQIKPSGGYYVAPFLPAGLAFNNSTGVLSGMPTVVSSAKSYTVTAYNVADVAGTAQLTITVSPGPPALSYSSPQTYSQKVAITPLSPTSSSVAAAGYSSTPAVLGSGFSGPTGVAVDAAGNTYVADYGNKAVKKIPAGNGTTVVLGTGFTAPYGVAVDAAGDVFVADFGASAVYKLTGGTGTPVKIGSGFNTPAGVAVDGSGNVYVADYGNNAVKELVGGTGTPVVLGSGFSHPIGISVDASGNVYVGDHGNNLVKKIPAGNGAPVVLGSGFTTPSGVAVDASGNIYVGDYGNSQVKMIPAGSNTPVVIGSGFSHPDGVAVDGAGNVYVADYSNNAVKQIQPTGGYYIGPFLPAGLAFNNSTGVISGTPTVASPAINYTVTAYNGLGVGSAPLIIGVLSNNDNLSNLVFSNGSLSPVFAPATTGYTATVASTVSSVTVTPTTADPAAAVTVDGSTVTSGLPSQTIPLVSGANTITIAVTAANGINTQTYTLTVTQTTGVTAFRPVAFINSADSALQADGIRVHQGVSPNGDGVNDYLQIDGIIQYPDNHLTIIDRNGALIYQARGYDNQSQRFDGHSTINGKMQQPGTYFYVLDYAVNGSMTHKTGYIILKY